MHNVSEGKQETVGEENKNYSTGILFPTPQYLNTMLIKIHTYNSLSSLHDPFFTTIPNPSTVLSFTLPRRLGKADPNFIPSHSNEFKIHTAASSLCGPQQLLMILKEVSAQS